MNEHERRNLKTKAAQPLYQLSAMPAITFERWECDIDRVVSGYMTENQSRLKARQELMKGKCKITR